MKELSPIYIYRAQWRATLRFVQHDLEKGMKHNQFSVFMILGVPIITTIASLVLCCVIVLRAESRGQQVDPLPIEDPLLASLAILSGALITAFTLLASWRNSVSAKTQGSTDYAAERWLLDTSSAHLLAGAYSSIIASVMVMLFKALNLLNMSWITVIGTSLEIGISSHVVMSLLIALPSLYAAYVQLNDVDPILNGHNDI